MYGKESICAGIVSYNPSLDRIIENVRTISRQVSHTYVFDNGSTNVAELKDVLTGETGVEIIEYPENAGIAFALNRICERAVIDGYAFIVTLDQDSVSTPGMVAELSRYMGTDVGIVSPQIVDRNKESASCWQEALDHKVVSVQEAARKGVITSGCLTSLEAFRFVGGFDESFFIDYVDYDFNKRLLLEGYQIIRTGNTALIHECGNFEPTWLWTPRKGQDGKWRIERFYSFGHSAFRCYYKARNRILYSKKYGPGGYIGGFEGARQIPIQILLTLLFEKGRRRKFMRFLEGIRDGKRQEVMPYVVKRDGAATCSANQTHCKDASEGDEL